MHSYCIFFPTTSPAPDVRLTCCRMQLISGTAQLIVPWMHRDAASADEADFTSESAGGQKMLQAWQQVAPSHLHLLLLSMHEALLLSTPCCRSHAKLHRRALQA